jgi:cellulose synthase/poly-beta-1,6-N-acetylglucosamine synthase-like glycosyltransferase
MFFRDSFLFWWKNVSKKEIPAISVVVPTKNSQRMIEKCLNSLTSQSYSNYEIIIVDGHSVDNTIKIVSKFPAKIVFEDGGTRASACNVGISHSRGEIVAFTDDDCLVPKGWLEKIAKHFEDPNVAVVGGPGLTPPDSDKWEKTFGAIRTLVIKSTNELGPVEQIPGCNSAYRKTTLIEKGGFTEYLPTAEETELHFRIMESGLKLVYDSELGVYHYPRVNLSKFLKQNFRYGVGKGLMLRLHPSALKMSDIVAVALILAPLVLVPILYFSFNFGLLLFVVLVSMFCGVALVISLYASITERQTKYLPLIFLVLIFYVYANGLGHTLGLLKLRRAK